MDPNYGLDKSGIAGAEPKAKTDDKKGILVEQQTCSTMVKIVFVHMYAVVLAIQAMNSKNTIVDCGHLGFSCGIIF